jgi:hypothetical protein
VRNTSQIQSKIHDAGITIMRWAIDPGKPDAYIDETVAANTACGAQMLVILNHGNLTWNTHLVTYLGSNCNLYEFSNEPDLNNLTWQQYLGFWNQHIPAMRAINGNAAFIGPALGVFANLQSYFVPWLQGCKSSGVLPDAVSYHVYPCTGGNNASWCAGRAGNFATCAQQVDAAVIGVLGYKLPQALTEWNIDASNPPAKYCSDPTFVTPWYHTALDSMVKGGLAVANQFDAGSGAGGGVLDLVNVTNYQPQAGYQPMVDKIQQYLGGTGGQGGFPDNPYGITIGNASAGGTLNAAAITDMQNLGITWLRYQVRWDQVDQTGTTNQNPATYIWTAWDDAVSKCNAAGINICLTIFGAPAQFQGPSGNPLNPAYTATFASQVAAAYTPNSGSQRGTKTIQALEIGNEDYDGTSGTSATPLVNTLVAVYPAVKAVSNCLVVCAALLQRNSTHYTSFMETLLNPATGAYTGGVFQADVLTYHYYTGIPDLGAPLHKPVHLDPTIDDPSGNGGQGIPSVTHAYQLIQAKKTAYGVTVPLWITETGFQINTNPGRNQYDTVSQALQWQYLQDVIDAARTSNGQVTKVFPFTLGYYDGYGSGVNARDGMSLVQGSVGSPIYTTAYTGLDNYIAQYPTWGAGGSSNATVFFTGTASGTLATANTMYSAPGGATDTNNTSALGTATGYGEVTSQGTVSAWAAAGSAPAPSGKGFLWDVATLENNDLLPGTYTAAVRLNTVGTGAVNITADIHCRLYKRTSGGVYTLIADCALTGQTIKTTKVVFNPTFTTTSKTSFATGDKLYVDIILNVTANTGASTMNIQLNDLSLETTSHLGLTTAQVVLPGYQPTIGGGSSFTVYFSSATSGVQATADKLYQVSGSPSVTWKYSRVGTSLGYGEVTSQGTVSAWAAASTLPNPTGKGYYLDSTSLNGQTFAQGNWSAFVRLNCAQGGDGSPQAGNLTADIVVRAFKYNGSGLYTPIVVLQLPAQALSSAFTTYAIPPVTGASVAFGPFDKLYIDIWLNVTANGNGASNQDVRLNKLSTDTSGLTGDPAAAVVTPGYNATGGGGGGTGTMLLTDVGLNLLRGAIDGQTTPKITYVALGTGTTPPASSDTKLGNEVFRKAVTSYTDGATGEETAVMFLSPNEANGISITEIGFIGGAATGQPNTGTLFGRALWSHTKSSQESITFPLDIQFTRG